MSHWVRLRDVEPADLPLLFEHQRDPEAVAMVARIVLDGTALM